MAAPVVDALPGDKASSVEVDLPAGKSRSVEALASVEEALRLLDAAMPDSRFKRRIIRSLALYLAEERYSARRPSARKHLWSPPPGRC